MIGKLYDALFRPALVAIGLLMVLSAAPHVSASPFGQGKFSADVPFGSVTSLTINLGSNVNLSLAPSGGSFVGNGSHTINVVSTDVVGYSLYIWANNTNMTSGGSSIPASGNGTAATLANNTWGYNTDGSSNYLGITSHPVELMTAYGPYKSGNNTTVTFGVKTDITKAAGSYAASVTYTAVALNY